MNMPSLLTASEAAKELDVCTAQIGALIKRGELKRVDCGDGRIHITRLSVANRKAHLAHKRICQVGKQLSPRDKRNIVQTLLAIGIITVDDFTAIRTAKLEAALRRVSV